MARAAQGSLECPGLKRRGHVGGAPRDPATAVNRVQQALLRGMLLIAALLSLAQPAYTFFADIGVRGAEPHFTIHAASFPQTEVHTASYLKYQTLTLRDYVFAVTAEAIPHEPVGADLDLTVEVTSITDRGRATGTPSGRVLLMDGGQTTGPQVLVEGLTTDDVERADLELVLEALSNDGLDAGTITLEVEYAIIITSGP